jgi:hypothetical protein
MQLFQTNLKQTQSPNILSLQQINFTAPDQPYEQHYNQTFFPISTKQCLCSRPTFRRTPSPNILDSFLLSKTMPLFQTNLKHNSITKHSFPSPRNNGIAPDQF